MVGSFSKKDHQNQFELKNLSEFGMSQLLVNVGERKCNVYIFFMYIYIYNMNIIIYIYLFIHRYEY